MNKKKSLKGNFNNLTKLTLKSWCLNLVVSAKKMLANFCYSVQLGKRKKWGNKFCCFRQRRNNKHEVSL